ncbi:hypothetical protein [Sediminibacillus massiliensis]|uniref:hypothetical protein n=1 Tax=Sediminibacillus massiliensis TaxID=1926277 RepID=UPI000988656A|nr:hypothetical protein [Sediminibacillus massiliensis]
MDSYNGALFSGEFSEDEETFYLKRVKNIQTQSIISQKQLQNLYHYLMNQNANNGSCTITVNDQIPVLLAPEEAQQLQQELAAILKVN